MLTELEQAVQAKRDADASLMEAIRVARAGGASLQAIADIVGLSRQRIYQLVGKTGRPAREAKMQARLDAIDARWNQFVDALAPMFTIAGKADLQRDYNQIDGKRRKAAIRGLDAASKRGLGTTQAVGGIRLVADQERAAAEEYALRLLEGNLTDPGLIEVRRQLDEAASLREELTALRDSRVSFLSHD